MRSLGFVLLSACLLAACAIDGSTGEVKGPIAMGGLLAEAAAKSRRAAPPPREWEELCKNGFDLEWRAPKPAPEGLLLGGGSGPALIALALRRTGATYAAAHVDQAASSLAPIINEPGIFRIRRTEVSARCNSLLDEVIRRWGRAGKAWSTASSCLAAERIGPYTTWDTREGSSAAPYFTRLVSEKRTLGDGFELSVLGEAMIERATGREIVRQMQSAQLQWKTPDEDHLYWGETRFCGPGTKMRPSIGLIGNALFARR